MPVPIMSPVQALRNDGTQGVDTELLALAGTRSGLMDQRATGSAQAGCQSRLLTDWNQ